MTDPIMDPLTDLTTGEVFISFTKSHTDVEIARKIALTLNANGIGYWMMGESPRAGEAWAPQIYDAIERCRVMVVILSQDANESAWVFREVDLAVHLKRAIVVFRVGPVVLSKNLRPYIHAEQWLDASSPPTEENIRRLVEAATRLVGRMPATSPAVAPPPLPALPGAPPPAPPPAPSEQPQAAHHAAVRELASRSTLHQALRNVLGGPYFGEKKFERAVYVDRPDAERALDHFLERGEYRCFVVTGGAGKGKSNLLCHAALALDEALPGVARALPILLPASALEFGGAESSVSLETQILGAIDSARSIESTHPDDWRHAFGAAGRFVSEDFYAWCAELRRQEAGAVIFVDAINELSGPNARLHFNAALDALLDRVNDGSLPVRFVLSCRSESWRHFVALPEPRWVAHDLQGPVVQLADFTPQESARAHTLYAGAHGAVVELSEEADQTLTDPFLFRMVYTAAKEAAERRLVLPSFRRRALMQRFAEMRRAAMTRAVQEAYAAQGRPLGSTAGMENLLTRYLIRMAGRMLEMGDPHIELWEVIEVARSLQLGDARFAADPWELTRAPDSIFYRFLDEGILGPRGEGRFGFLHEMYFEYSLGRYLATECWFPVREDVEAVRMDFQRRLEQHVRLTQEKDFSNLAGAIPFALSQVDEDPGFARARPQLVPMLLKEMVRAKRFNWTQLAIATIRDMRLASRDVWMALEGATAERENAEAMFRELLDVFDETTRSDTDFVALWDIAPALADLATANAGLVLEHIERWSTEGQKWLHTFFAVNALWKIAQTRGNEPKIISEVVGRIAGLVREPRVRNDFWLARALVSAALALADADRTDERLPIGLATALRTAVDGLARDGAGSVRGQALAALPFLSQGQPAHLRAVLDLLDLLDPEADQWAWWNVAYAMHAWPDTDTWRPGLDIAIEILRRAAAHPSSDVRFAALRATQLNPTLGRYNSGVVAAIRRANVGSRWGVQPADGPLRGADRRRTGVVYHPMFLEPEFDHHIECRERVQVIVLWLERLCADRFTWVVPRAAKDEEIASIHGSPDDRTDHRTYDRHRDGSPWRTYLQDLERSADEIGRGQSRMVESLELRAESLRIAAFSAGAVLKGIDYVMNEDAPAAWAINRPPGHLANNKICIYNNVAIGAKYAQETYQLERVLVVDCDAHHGQHTDYVFREDPNVLYFSIHVDQDYTREDGTVDNVGRGLGEGYTFNLPHPTGMGDDGYAYIVDKLLVPIAREFRPEIILLSAGFDELAVDQLTPQCVLTERAFAHLARRLRDVAQELRIKLVSTLEGGYALEGNARALIHMMNAFGDWGLSEEEIGFSPVPAEVSVRNTAAHVRKLVRERVIHMAAACERDPTYPFDTRSPHWQEILAGEEPTISPSRGA